MSNTYDKLKAEFPANQISWKIQRCGLKNGNPYAIVVPFIDARDVQDRLDSVLGCGKWKTSNEAFLGGVKCIITANIDGETVVKEDVSELTDYEPLKGAVSVALRRAAVHLGIGRYLYRYPTVFAKFVQKGTAGAQYVEIEGAPHYWIPDLQIAAAPQTPSIKSEQSKAIETLPVMTASISAAHFIANAAKPRFQPITEVITPQTNLGIVRTTEAPTFEFGNIPVPFGRTQGKQIKDLTSEEIQGLLNFYEREKSPKGKALQFREYLYGFLAQKEAKV